MATKLVIIASPNTESYTVECSKCGPLGVVDPETQDEFCRMHFLEHDEEPQPRTAWE